MVTAHNVNKNALLKKKNVTIAHKNLPEKMDKIVNFLCVLGII